MIRLVIDNLWRSLALLAMQSNPAEADHWLLVCARVMAPAATFGAFYAVAYSHITDWWNRRSLQRLQGHTVIVGAGVYGRAFAEGCAGDVAVLGPLAPGSSSRERQVRALTGTGLNPAELQQVGVSRATTVVIVNEGDADNLRVLTGVLGVVPPDHRLDIIVRIDNHWLSRQLDEDDDFAKPPQTAFEVRTFNLARVSARTFLREHPLADLALLHVQPRVHLVIIGWSRLALELMEQLARTGPCAGLDCPKVDVFAEDENAARAELTTLQPVFAADLDGGPIDPVRRVLSVRLHGLAAGAVLPTPQQLSDVEPNQRRLVTAVIVAAGSDEVSASTALALRDRVNAEGRWQAPIFVYVREESRLTELLNRRRARPDPAERVECIPSLAAICRLEVLTGERERGARAFHAAYRASRAGSAGGTAPLSAASDVPWEQLPQTYREASRRAIDHLPLKLLSAGYHLRPGPLGTGPQSDFARDAQELETLARLEHQSWSADRLLAGWNPGQERDDRRRVNPAITVHYADLDRTLGAGVSAHDVEQIHAARRFLGSAGTNSALREVRLGLFGHNYLSLTDAEHLHRELPTALDQFVDGCRGRFVTLLTPLAPGSDLILTRGASRLLADQGVPHRIVVVRTLPASVMVADFLQHRQRAGAWTSPSRPLPSDEAAAVETLNAERQSLVESVESLIVNLEPAAIPIEQWSGAANAFRRRRAYRRANTYLAFHSDLLVACLDSARRVGPMPAASGGTEEALIRAGRLAARRRRLGQRERPLIVVLDPSRANAGV
jgi:hypothetical protein